MFSVGDKIAHPSHGAGVIDGIERRKIDGVLVEYYSIKLPNGNMLVFVPVNGCEKLGVRRVIDCKNVDMLLSRLSDADVDVEQYWSKRYKENLDRLRSGDLFEVFKVIKTLFLRDCKRCLSSIERRMLTSAKQILVSEIAIVKSLTFKDVEAMIDQIIMQDAAAD